MKKVLLLLSLSIIALCVACKEESKPSEIAVIDLSNANQLFGTRSVQDVAKNIRYVALETNEDVIVGNVTPFNIFSYKNFIIFSDNTNTIFIFNRDGKLVNKFNRTGRGPEEYNHITGLSINPYNDNLLVNTGSNTLEYDLNGVFIKSIPSIKFEGYIPSDPIIPLKGDRYIGTLMTRQQVGTKCAYISNSSGEILKLIDTPLQETEDPDIYNSSDWEDDKLIEVSNMEGAAATYYSSRISAYLDRAYIYSHDFNYILSTNGKIVDTLYSINYGKFYRTPESSVEYDDFLSLNLFFESDKYLFIRTIAGGKLKKGKTSLTNLIYEKESGEIVILDASKEGNGNLIDRNNPGISFLPISLSRDGKTAINKIDVPKFKEMAADPRNSEQIRKMGEALDYEDNFVVAIMDL